MIQRGINTRVGPICRTVEDVATVLDAYAGYDPEGRADRVQHRPHAEKPVRELRARASASTGYRIGVIREYMDKSLFTVADAESDRPRRRAIEDLRRARRDDRRSGPAGRAVPELRRQVHARSGSNQQFIAQFPACSRRRERAPTTITSHAARHVLRPVARAAHRGGPAEHPQHRRHRQRDAGDGRYNFNAYIRERGDAEIQSLTDLIDEGELLDRPGAREPQVRAWRAPIGRGRSRRASALQTRFTRADRRLRLLRGAAISTRWSIRRATSRRRS